MKILSLLTLLLTFPIFASADTSCVDIENDISRLQCYDGIWKNPSKAESPADPFQIFNQFLVLASGSSGGYEMAFDFFKGEDGECHFLTGFFRSFEKLFVIPGQNVRSLHLTTGFTIYSVPLGQIDLSKSNAATASGSIEIAMNRDQAITIYEGQSTADPVIEQSKSGPVVFYAKNALFDNPIYVVSNRSQNIPIASAHVEDRQEISEKFIELVKSCQNSGG